MVHSRVLTDVCSHTTTTTVKIQNGPTVIQNRIMSFSDQSSCIPLALATMHLFSAPVNLPFPESPTETHLGSLYVGFFLVHV